MAHRARRGLRHRHRVLGLAGPACPGRGDDDRGAARRSASTRRPRSRRHGAPAARARAVDPDAAALRVIREHGSRQVWVHVPHGDPVEVWIDLERRAAGDRLASAGELDAAARPRRAAGRRGDVRAPGDLPLGYHTLRARSGGDRGGDAADRHAGLARAAGAAGRPAGLGARDPAVQRALRASPGASATWSTWPTWRSGRRPSTARTSSWSTRCTRPSRSLRWSRRRTCRPAGGSPTRCTCGSSGSRSTPTAPTTRGRGSTRSLLAAAATPHSTHDRPRHGLDREARRRSS